MAIKNPVYCGKIFIPPYKEENGCYVIGLHEPLITEALFDDVQDVLEGRSKNSNDKPKIVSHNNLPLRGFLICPKCNRMLSGSASKGMTQYYHYYHCSSACGVRFKAKEANEIFENELSKYIPKPGRIELYSTIVAEDFKQQSTDQQRERRQLLSELDKINVRMQNARNMKVDGELSSDDFQSLKNESNFKIGEIEKKLRNLSEIADLLKKALLKLTRLIFCLKTARWRKNGEIISSMYPENLHFDGESF